jgi:hypothetical protein
MAAAGRNHKLSRRLLVAVSAASLQRDLVLRLHDPPDPIPGAEARISKPIAMKSTFAFTRKIAQLPCQPMRLPRDYGDFRVRHSRLPQQTPASLKVSLAMFHLTYPDTRNRYRSIKEIGHAFDPF